MRQTSFASAGFERYSKPTRRAAFLGEMDRIVPWKDLCGLIEPVYPKPGNGRPPVGLERLLRIYFLQQWFNLSDPGVEEALYDSATMRGFVNIDLGREPAPDETTICKFRHLLEQHDLGRGWVAPFAAKPIPGMISRRPRMLISRDIGYPICDPQPELDRAGQATCPPGWLSWPCRSSR
jgi:Transposase domain (DUF772)